MSGNKKTGKTAKGKRDEAVSAKEVVLALARSVKGCALYLPSNPLHLKFFRTLSEKLSRHLESFGDLRLDFDHYQMTCAGTVVYENTDPRESLAFRLYADGIRSLVLCESIGVEEIRGVVEILGRTRSGEEDTDMVTELWEKDYPHVLFALGEEGGAAGPGDLGARADDPERRRQGIRSALAGETSAAGEPGLPESPRELFILSESELKALQEAIPVEQGRDPFAEATGILRAILEGGPDEDTFRQFVEIIARLCRDLLAAGRIGDAVQMISVFTDLKAREDLPGKRRDLLLEARTGILSEDVLEALGRILDRPGEVRRETLLDLVRTFETDAIAPFCGLLGTSEKRETREALLEALVDAGRDSPEAFFPYLGDSRWYLVRNTIHILRGIGSEAAAEQMAAAAKHADERVRWEVLRGLETVPGESAAGCLLEFLEDPSASVKIGATRALARRGDERGAARLRDLVAAPAFKRRPLEERRATLEAFGAADPDAAVSLCRKMLSSRRWFNRAQEHEDAVCAVAGLRSAGTEEAMELLREAQVMKKGEAALLATKALESLLGGRRKERR